jgi:hypothetical protein
MTLASPAVFNLNNTAAETDLINVTVPANTLGTNGTLRYQFYGWFGRPSLAGEQSWQMRFYWGGSLVTWRDGSTNFACGSNGSNGGSSDGKFTLTLRANGTGVQNGFIASGLPGFGNIPHDYDVQGLGKDTTHDQNFRITCQLLTGDGQRWCNIISHELVAY